MTTDGAAAVTAVPNYHNYSLHAIVAAYGLAMVPHGYYTYKLMSVTKDRDDLKGVTSNFLPRQNLLNLRPPRLPESTFSTLARARGAHLNALETAPLFAAAMLAGNMAGLEPGELNAVAAQYLGVRCLYTALYVGLRGQETWAYLRTGVWAWSVGLPVWVLVRAGRRLDGRNIAGRT